MHSNKEKVTKLIFVYNANSSKVNTYLGAMHKLFNQKNYSCNLCRITYGVFTENKLWNSFRNDIDIPMGFLHSNEFKKQYASKFSQKFEFPIVLGITSNGWEVIVDTFTLNGLNSAEALIEIVKKEI